jgi:glycosyltransferase involved in cell wall biosynthesis
MNSVQPLVTIAIPTHNRASYLREAIHSALNQTYRNIEVIVSDNCSDDCTGAVVRGFADPRLRYFRQEVNMGMVPNWNFCLKHAEGEFFVLLSDDDVLEVAAIQRLLQRFDDPTTSLVYSRVLYIDADSRPIARSGDSPSDEAGTTFVKNCLLGKRCVLPSATLHRSDSARSVQGYPDIGTASDGALRLAVALEGTVRFCPETLVKYRIHSEALSGQIKQVVSSHEEFARWVESTSLQLHEYHEQVHDYCMRAVYSIAVSEALRGHKDSAHVAMEAARRLGCHGRREAMFRLFSFAPVRLVASMRRELLSGLRGLLGRT